MDPRFLTRCLKTTAWVTIVISLFTTIYYNLFFSLALLIGSAWNIGNFWLIAHLGSAILIKDSSDRKKVGLWLLLKFPAWYGIGYLVLRYTKLPIPGLLIGFSILFLVVLLKVIGLHLTKDRTVGISKPQTQNPHQKNIPSN
ncbi:MAG: hypothetical protein ACE14V_04740 [bacterium]